MRALAMVHQRDAGPGVFADAAADRNVELDDWLIAETADPPAPLGSYDAVFVLGAAADADQEHLHSWLAPEKRLLAGLLEAETPLLGVCLGGQLVAEAAGAIVHRASRPEIGWSDVELTAAGRADPVLGPLGERTSAFQWHSYESPLPPGAVALARSETCLQAFRTGPCAWGIQFHAEVTAADADRWINDYRSDPDAVAIGLDPKALGAETRERIGPWNDAGRALSGRFLDEAAARR